MTRFKNIPYLTLDAQEQYTCCSIARHYCVLSMKELFSSCIFFDVLDKTVIVLHAKERKSLSSLRHHTWTRKVQLTAKGKT